MLNNPIFKLEHKRLLTVKREPPYRSFIVVAYGLLVLLTLLAAVNLVTFPLVPFVRTNEASFVAVVIIILQGILNLVLVLRILYRAMSIAGRERTSVQNWETFILTGVDARSVLMAKWQVVVRSLWREFLVLGFLRALIFPLGVMLHYLHRTYGYQATLPYTYVNVMPDLPILVVTAASILVLTLLQLPLFAAFGVLAASRRSTSPAGVGRGMSTWLLIVLGTCVVLAVVYFAYSEYAFFSVDTTIYWTEETIRTRFGGLHTIILGALTFTDTALLSPFGLTYFAFYPHAFYGQILTSTLLPVVLMLFWTWAALRLSIWLSRRQGMTQVKA